MKTGYGTGTLPDWTEAQDVKLEVSLVILEGAGKLKCRDFTRLHQNTKHAT